LVDNANHPTVAKLAFLWLTLGGQWTANGRRCVIPDLLEVMRRGRLPLITKGLVVQKTRQLLRLKNYFTIKKDKNKKGSETMRSHLTKILVATAVGFFASYGALAQEVKNLPAGATAHLIYFPTGGYGLDAKDKSQIHDVVALIQSNPDFVATILGKADSAGSPGFNEHLSQRRANAVFEALVYNNKVAENRIQMCWTGERLPFTSTADETMQAQNRLAAIIVSKATDAHFCGG
jgi:outer membrane protein OmpA-like peptidoglycan-associated protein